MSMVATKDGARIRYKKWGSGPPSFPMLVLVLTGENASGPFVVEQARFCAPNVSGVAVRDAGHWLMNEAPDQVVPGMISFLN
jgi:hypothetical protein